MADHMIAIRDFLKSDAGVAAIVSARVYAGELPRSEVQSMPKGVVVVNPAGGGLLGREYQVYADQRVDIDCYGATPYESWKLYRAVRKALKNMQQHVRSQTLLFWAKSSSEGTSTRDPITDWPITISSWQILFSEDYVT